MLYCRVTVNGTTAEFSTREKIIPGNWNQLAQRLEAKDKKANTLINTLIDSARWKLKMAALASNDNLKLTARDLIDKLRKPTLADGPVIEPITSIVERYINSIRGANANTLRNHRIKLKNFAEYQEQAKAVFTPASFDIVQANRFVEWFQKTRQTENVTTANRNVLFIKTALQWAVQKGELKTFELLLFQGKKDPVKPVIYLTAEEVNLLVNYSFHSRMLNNVRDLYVFQIETGLSYCDLWGDFEIIETEYGSVLTGTRGKNGQAFFVPVGETALAILQRHDHKLPRYCNEPYNRVLKEIAAVLGINKRLTTHIGRKTFATTKEDNGWSRESISIMLGHKSLRTTEQYYLAQTPIRILNEMKIRSVAG